MQSSEVHSHWKSDPSETLKNFGDGECTERAIYVESYRRYSNTKKKKKWGNPKCALGKSRKKKLPFRRKKPRPEPNQLNWLLLLWRSCSSPWVPAEALSSAAPTHKQQPFPLQSGHSLTSHLLILIPVSSYLLSCKLDVTKNQIWQANQSSHPYWKNGTQTFTFSTCLWDTSLPIR